MPAEEVPPYGVSPPGCCCAQVFLQSMPQITLWDGSSASYCTYEAHTVQGHTEFLGTADTAPPYPCKDVTQQCLRCWDLHQQRKSVRKTDSELKFQVVFSFTMSLWGKLPCPGSSQGLLQCHCRRLGVKPRARYHLSTPAKALGDLRRRRHESTLTVTPVS